MPRGRKKLIVLVCLVVFWIGLILVQRSQRQGVRSTQVMSGPQRTSARRGRPATPPRRQAKKRREMPRLKPGQIERARPRFEPEVRNIFASIDRPSFPSSPPAKPEATSTLPPPPDPFLEESKKVRFLGYAEADGTTMAFIAYGNEALVVPETGVFAGRFRVKAVKEDAVILNSLDGTREVRLGLSPGPDVALPSRGKQRRKRPWTEDEDDS